MFHKFNFSNPFLSGKNKEEVLVQFQSDKNLCENELDNGEGELYVNQPFLIKDEVNNENVGLTYEAAKFVYESLKQIFEK